MSAVYDVRIMLYFDRYQRVTDGAAMTGRYSIADHGPAKRSLAHTHTLLTRMDEDKDGFIDKVEI